MDGYRSRVRADFRRQRDKLLNPFPDQACKRAMNCDGIGRFRERCRGLRVTGRRFERLSVVFFHDYFQSRQSELRGQVTAPTGVVAWVSTPSGEPRSLVAEHRPLRDSIARPF